MRLYIDGTMYFFQSLEEIVDYLVKEKFIMVLDHADWLKDPEFLNDGMIVVTPFKSRAKALLCQKDNLAAILTYAIMVSEQIIEISGEKIYLCACD